MSNLTSGHNQKLILWLLASFFLIVSTITFLIFTQNDEPSLYVTINEAYYILDEGESTLVTFEASQELGAFTYTSNDTSVVQFIENRLISVGTGSTTITVSSQSNPSVFQTVSVIVRPKDVEPEAPVEPEVPAEPEPEVPVEVEPELPEDPEPELPLNPVDPDDSDDEVVITSPSIYTITITNETGAVITTLELEEGSFITTSGLNLSETFKGFYLEGETCEDEPFDLETPITENLTLIQASFNDQEPCLQLDYIVLSGRPVAGTELKVDIFPIGANVTISWYTSVNNRTYREIPGESGSTFTVRPEDSGKFIRVYVVSDSNPPVVRFDTLKLDVFGTVSDNNFIIPTIATNNLIINIDAADPSSYVQNTLNNGVTVTSITNTSVFDFNVSSNVTTAFIDLGQPISANESFTFEAWVFDSSSQTGPRNIISSSTTVFYISTAQLRGGIGGTFDLVTKKNFIPNEWKHTVLTFDDPNDTLKMYINGIEVSTATTIKSFDGETLRAGAHDGPSSFWEGLMNDIRVYNRALTAAEVSGNYTATKNKYE